MHLCESVAVELKAFLRLWEIKEERIYDSYNLLQHSLILLMAYHGKEHLYQA
jgi:hypothetical protein